MSVDRSAIDEACLRVYHPGVWRCCTLYRKIELNDMVLEGLFTVNLLPAFKHGNDRPIPLHQYESLAGSLLEAFVTLMCQKDADADGWEFVRTAS